MELPEWRKAEVDALYAQGKSVYQVQLETSLSAEVIRAHLKATGQTRPARQGKPSKITPALLAKIDKLRADNVSWAAICRRFGVGQKPTQLRYYEWKKDQKREEVVNG